MPCSIVDASTMTGAKTVKLCIIQNGESSAGRPLLECHAIPSCQWPSQCGSFQQLLGSFLELGGSHGSRLREAWIRLSRVWLIAACCLAMEARAAALELSTGGAAGAALVSALHCASIQVYS